MRRACLSLALLLGTAHAAEVPVESCGKPREMTGRPRIGLALAGGGGKGWAHVGVLKVLEELRVPIDCIAGTSAGSIVGGAYASGMSPDELLEIVAHSDWSAIFQDSGPRRYQAFERKQEDMRGLWDLEVGVGKHGIKVPSGLFAGQEVNALLRRMTTHAIGVKTFDDLQVPFRAVATDLRTGELVILDRGELASAMRSSMAVPGAFTPEVIDGRVLVDGGLRQNLPVETVRAMGADIVIAVDLGTSTPVESQLANPVAVARQMMNILLDLNVYASRDALEPQDVLITPKVTKFSSGDFSKGAELVPLGEDAARAVQDELAALGLPPPAYAAFREAQQQRSQARSQGTRVEVDTSHLRNVNPAYVKGKFAADERAGALHDQRVEHQISTLLGEGDYERIDYRYQDQPDGERVLVITPREKPWGPGYLRLGLQLATDFKEDTYFNLLGSYRRTWLNRLGGELRSGFSLGKNTALSGELYQPVLQGQGLFIAPSLAVSQTSRNLFIGNDPVANYRIQSVGGEIDVGWTFPGYAELRLGLQRINYHYIPSVAIPLFPEARLSSGGLVARFAADRLDSSSFPRQGYSVSGTYLHTFSALGADEEYQKVAFDALTAFSVGSHTVQLELSGGGAIDGDLPIYDLQYLGGLFNLSGYLIDQLQGQKSILGRASYYYRLAHVPVLLKGLYVGLSLEMGQVYDRLDGASDAGLLPAAAVFIGGDSALGPFYLAYGRALDEKLGAIYFYLGKFY
ncbi:MAG: patatin-like phospholipase family protein [Burkholderiales bacterium]|nr:patatin-like phospholipase family protein [Burkholderiales bacterium]